MIALQFVHLFIHSSIYFFVYIYIFINLAAGTFPKKTFLLLNKIYEKHQKNIYHLQIIVKKKQIGTGETYTNKRHVGPNYNP